MVPPFDIFRIMRDKQPLWLEPAPTLEEAKARVKELGKTSPGEYLILCQKTGDQITVKTANMGQAGV
ncbi:MAG: hypothetical protein ACRD3Q_00605 [Terriglobales bacterium]